MSYIRCSTPVRKGKRDGAYEPISNTYAYGDGKYVCISNGWTRGLNILKDAHGPRKGKKIFDGMTQLEQMPQVFLTDAEMRYMCLQYLRQTKSPHLKKRSR